MCKVFYLIPLNNKLSQEKTNKISVYFSIFYDRKKHRLCRMPSSKCFFFGITVTCITKKLKSKRLVCLFFLWWQVFLKEQAKIFYKYSGPKYYLTQSHYREVPRWEIFMEQELRFGLDLGRFGIFWGWFFHVFMCKKNFLKTF